MYTNQLSGNIRQGDIIKKLYYCSPSFYSLTQEDKINIPSNLTIRLKYFAIVSQCCELQLKTNGQPRREHILIVPLSMKMPFNIDSEEFVALKKNGIDEKINDPIQYFYYENGGVLEAPVVADFTAILPINSKLVLLDASCKLLELDMLHRHLFRRKLARYFGRIPLEEKEFVNGLNKPMV